MNRSSFNTAALILFTVSAALLSGQTNNFPSSGNVGIGTTAPVKKLDVYASQNGDGIRIGHNFNTTDYAELSFSGNNVVGDGASIRSYRTSTNHYGNEGDLRFFTSTGAGGASDNGAEAMRIDSSGNVGIGTTAPAAKLHVSSGDSSFAVFGPNATWNSYLVTGAGSSQVASNKAQMISTNGNLHIDSGTGQNIYIGYYTPSNTFLNPSGGNVGIGTTAPANRLDVNGAISYGAGGTWNPGTIYSDANWGVILRAKQLAPTVAEFMFANADGTERMRIGPTGNFGIGTTSPGAKLDVNAGSGETPLNLNGAASGFGIRFTGGANGYIGQGNWAVNNLPTGYLGISGGATGGVALGYNAGVEALRVSTNGNVGIGTTNPTQKLAVNGTIRAKEVIVDTGWSDYVFRPDYHLASLSEVEWAIQKDGHLPGIPSASEVAEHGVSVGEMQAKLLAKIEELTLHQIELQKQLYAQQAEILALKTANTLKTQ